MSILNFFDIIRVKEKVSLKKKIKEITYCLKRAEISKDIALKTLPVNLNTFKAYRSMGDNKNQARNRITSTVESLGDSILHLESAMNLTTSALNKYADLENLDILDHYLEVLKNQTDEVDDYFKTAKKEL